VQSTKRCHLLAEPISFLKYNLVQKIHSGGVGKVPYEMSEAGDKGQHNTGILALLVLLTSVVGRHWFALLLQSVSWLGADRIIHLALLTWETTT